MIPQEKPWLWRYAVRHVLGLFASTVVFVIYLMFVTLIDGWGSRFGNGLGGGIAIVVWALMPTLAVGRRFARMQQRAMGVIEALVIPIAATVPLAVFTIWAGLGLRSDRPEVRLSDLQFWALHLSYIAVAFAFFAGVMWARAWVEARSLRREA